MTNGEKLKVMFPSMIIGFITESQVGIYFVKNQHSATVFSLKWWNAEYKEPKTGYWREVDTNMYVCSKCSHVLTIDSLDNSILEMNYCPNCGVKMIEPQESEG